MTCLALGWQDELEDNVAEMSFDSPPLPEDPAFWYPQWREMWEESLDESARKRITNAVWSGEALNDPVEARYAVTLASQKRGAWRWWPALALIYMGMAVTWLVFATRMPLWAWTWSDWLVGVVHATVLVVAAPLAYRRYRLISDSERRNRGVVASHQSSA
jgi:hypothetical protein